jgi:hypothetical protein
VSPAKFVPPSARSTAGTAWWRAPDPAWLARPAPGPTLDQALLTRTTRSPADVGATPIVGCSSQVDGTDPLAVAASVAAWVFCGAGPAAGVSSHGRQVLFGWSAVEFPARPTTVLAVGLLDPRAAPVVADAEVVRATDWVPHRVVLTLYRGSSGQWAVDDLFVVGG